MKTILKRLLLALLFIPTVIFAQSKVTGMVTEQATALPIPAVNVIVKNTSRGASTDFDGKYSITAKAGCAPSSRRGASFGQNLLDTSHSLEQKNCSLNGTHITFFNAHVLNQIIIM